jgi:hypothetical protein
LFISYRSRREFSAGPQNQEEGKSSARSFLIGMWTVWYVLVNLIYGYERFNLSRVAENYSYSYLDDSITLPKKLLITDGLGTKCETWCEELLLESDIQSITFTKINYKSKAVSYVSYKLGSTEQECSGTFLWQMIQECIVNETFSEVNGDYQYFKRERYDGNKSKNLSRFKIYNDIDDDVESLVAVAPSVIEYSVSLPVMILPCGDRGFWFCIGKKTISRAGNSIVEFLNQAYRLKLNENYDIAPEKFSENSYRYFAELLTHDRLPLDHKNVKHFRLLSSSDAIMERMHQMMSSSDNRWVKYELNQKNTRAFSQYY